MSKPSSRALIRFFLPVVLVYATFGVGAQTFPSTLDKVPPNWTGPVFKLSQDYPKSLPTETFPWATIDFTTQPQNYVNSVYGYVLEGNIGIDWQVQKNPVRKWYHAPWMHYGDSGREFIHGLTRERTTPKPTSAGQGELGPDQTKCAQNWAVGFFNPTGGYQVGQIWGDPKNPDVTKSQFPEGTVIAKLLFTAADDTEAQYLKNTFQWQGNIHQFTGPTCPQGPLKRTPQTVYLLQIDLAVKDKRASETGWVFGTMAYNAAAQGSTPWERMRPVGIMWGNDLAKNQQWINTTIGTPQHLGYQGLLNGPVDNPKSSCLSCHATAEVPSKSPMLPGAGDDAARWFKNYLGSQSFDAGATPVDYSLQIAMGIQNLRKQVSAGPNALSAANAKKLAPEEVRILRRAFDSGRELQVPVLIRGELEYPIGR